MTKFPGYSTKARIYESTSSKVYRATRNIDAVDVVLKVLNRRTIPVLNRLSDTSRSTGSPIGWQGLDGVIGVYGLEPYGNTLIMSLEDFGADSLKILMNDCAFGLAEALVIAIQIVNSLGTIHSADVIHKDLNPSNIVYNPSTGRLKVIDFGISSELAQENPIPQDTEALVGSLAYVSPEQTGRMNRSVDYRSDYYSVGVTLYELFSGRLPFCTSDPLEMVHCHIAKLPEPLHEVDPGIPEAVSRIVMKLLQKDAQDRYQRLWCSGKRLERMPQQIGESRRDKIIRSGAAGHM